LNLTVSSRRSPGDEASDMCGLKIEEVEEENGNHVRMKDV